MTAVPLWRSALKTARQRSDRIERKGEKVSLNFHEALEALKAATNRAEAAAVILMDRDHDLAETVARQKPKD